MSGRRKWSLGIAGGLLLALLLLFYTPPGLALIGRLAAPLTGGQIRLQGLGGVFPGRLHVTRLEVADKKGVWLRIDQAALEWSALALIRNHIDIDKVSAAHIAVLRRPLPPEKKSSGETPRIDIAHLSAPDIALGVPVIGHAVTLAASGDLHFKSLKDLAANLLVTRAGSSDRYRVDGGIRNSAAHGNASIREGVDGILGKLANLPGLGAVNLSAEATGDANANTVSFHLSAGQLTAQGQGTIALATSRADIDMTLAAPAMAPRPDTSWGALAGDMHVHGGFTTPQVRGHFVLTDGRMAGASIATLTLNADGDAGRVNVTGMAEKLAIPGDAGLLARAPLQFTAQADLRDPLRPVHLSLNHPLARLEAVAETAGPLHASGDLTVPSLAPFGALAKTVLAGDAALHATVDMHDKQTRLTLDGALHMTGATLPAKLLGKTQLAATAVLEGQDITASHLAINGAAVKVQADGSLRAKRLNYTAALDLTDLSKLAGTLQGSLTLKANAAGPLDSAEVTGSGSAMMATKGFARQRIAIELKAQGLPAVSNATLALGGRLDGAPLTVRAAMTGNKTRHVTLTGRWRSLNADADLSLAKNGALGGKAKLALKQLSDVAALTGAKLSGAAIAAITFRDQRGKTGADIDATLSGFNMAPVAAQSVSLKGTAGDITGKPRLDMMLNAGRVTAQGWTGSAQGKIEGPLDRLDIALNAAMTDPDGNKANARGAATLDLPGQQLMLAALTGDWRTLKLVLDGPATLRFEKGLAIDRLAAHLGKGRLVVAGTLTPNLTLTASAEGLNLADYAAFAPDFGPQGSISGTAELHGTLAAPLGRISLRGQNMHAAFSPGGMPPAGFTLAAQLQGDHAMVDANLDAGAIAHLFLKGTVPLTAGGQMALHAEGKADLALLDAVTAISGRRVRGTVTLAGDASGTLSAPRISGRGSLAGGEFQDYAQGVRVQDITASFSSDGNRLTLSQLSGRAGPGTLSGSGAIDLTAQDMPITMKLEVQNARPITSDLMTADLSGSVTLSGHVKTAMTLGGDIQVTRATINVPQSFPPAVAVLNVRRRGQPPPPPPPKPSRVNLDLLVRTAGPVFVRGHGMDADMGGSIRVGGTVGAPAVTGGFRMNRGTFSLAGQTLNFTSGEVRFDGSGLHGRLDPSLNFVAQTVSGGVTATLTITGYASQPKIALTSTPSLPQDEVVAHLLFQQSVKQLSPLQLASIAQAAAEMGGIGGGFNPLGSVRQTLGLDRLAVGSVQGGASGTESQTTVEAGRYVARNVYVGVKQNLSGGTQTQVQVDITRRLKAQATVNTGATTTTVQGNALQDNGSSIGLSYQFQY